MDNMKLNILSTTRLLASYNDKDIILKKLLIKKQVLKNRLFGEGK